MTTIVKCNSIEEFNKCIEYIFFSEDRAKTYLAEKTVFEYEIIQDTLGIAIKEHNIANEKCEDIELDLYQEFLNGNYKYSNITFPCYVHWEYSYYGYDSTCNIYFLEIFNDNDITLDTLLEKQKYYEDERNHYLEISKKLKKYC